MEEDTHRTVGFIEIVLENDVRNRGRRPIEEDSLSRDQGRNLLVEGKLKTDK